MSSLVRLKAKLLCSKGRRGRNGGLLINWLKVRVLPGAPFFFLGNIQIMSVNADWLSIAGLEIIGALRSLKAL